MAIFSADDTPRQVMEKIQYWTVHGGAASIIDEGQTAIAKLRLVGIYDDRQAGYFMLRTRIPGGRLTWQQAQVIGRVAQEFAVRPAYETAEPDRFLELTTRQDIQIHWIRLEHVPDIWQRYAAAGITTLQACGDTARNITGCPVSGVNRDEVLDTYPLVQQLTQYVLDFPEYGAALPRKFKIAITGCRDDCILAPVNDLAFTPAQRDGEIGFSVWAGGGLSDYPRLASDLDLFITPDQVIETTKAVIAVYKEFGDYQNKAVNRFRRLVDEIGPDRLREEIERRAACPLRRAGEGLTGAARYDHVGVHRQRQAGRYYVGLAVPVGRMMGEELVAMAELARVYGDGQLRLTPRQNLIITGVDEACLDALLREPLLQKFSPFPAPFVRSIVACTSAPFCKFGIFNVKDRGLELARMLDSALGSDEFGPIKLHLSGCKASCGQVQIADIGLRASLAKDEDAYHEAFDVAIGGDLQAGRLAEWLELEVPVQQVYAGVKRLLALYRQQRTDRESFQDFLRRQDRTNVRRLFKEAVL